VHRRGTNAGIGELVHKLCETTEEKIKAGTTTPSPQTQRPFTTLKKRQIARQVARAFSTTQIQVLVKKSKQQKGK
jgi:hypothetical protein